MLSVTLVAALFSHAAAAGDKPIADHTRSVTVVPFALIEPRLEVDYDQALSDKTSFTAGISAGRSNSLLLRLFNALSDEKFTLQTYGAYGGYNYHFKDFNRGWYASGIARFDYVNATYGDEAAGKYSRLALGPALGWKVAGDGGFTFKWDIGLGYGSYFGYDAGSGSAQVGKPKNGVAGLGSLNLGMSF